MPTLRDLAELLGGEVLGDPNLEIGAIMPLEWAGPGQISFFANSRYAAAARSTRASALVTAAPLDGGPAHQLIHPDPYLAAAKLARFFYAPAKRPAGVHPSAVVEGFLGKNVYVGPLAVVERGAQIADGAELHPHAFVGEDASVGKDTVLHPGARVLARCQIGDRCVLHAGAIIGSDGFGFAEDKTAPDGQRRVKVPQLGIVVVGDDVEIGANTTIDRATFGATVIGPGTKIDNLVQVAHNVQTGPDCVLVAQVGISGSTKLGKRVVLGGQAGVVGHLNIGDDAKVAGQSGVHKDLPPGATVIGSPSRPVRVFQRQELALRHLDEIRKRVLGRKEFHE